MNFAGKIWRVGTLCFIIGLLAAACTSNALAQTVEGSIRAGGTKFDREVEPLATAQTFVGDLRFYFLGSEQTRLGVEGSFSITPDTRIEIPSGMEHDFTLDEGAEVSAWRVRLNGVVRHEVSDRFALRASGGASLLDWNYCGRSCNGLPFGEEDWGWNIGGGPTIAVRDWLAVEGDVRFDTAKLEECCGEAWANGLEVTVGLNLRFPDDITEKPEESTETKEEEEEQQGSPMLTCVYGVGIPDEFPMFGQRWVRWYEGPIGSDPNVDWREVGRYEGQPVLTESDKIDDLWMRDDCRNEYDIFMYHRFLLEAEVRGTTG